MRKIVTYIIKYTKLLIKTKLHNIKIKRYWTKYYKIHRENSIPSDFAQYCTDKYFRASKGLKLLELGCGNGRDSIYFAKKGLNILGLDIVKEEINYLNRKYSNKKLVFKCYDFTTFKKKNYYDYIYSRFTIHTISEEQELLTLKNSYENLKENGILLIEARSIKDEMFKKSKKISETEGETDHYRRFLVYEKFIDKIRNQGFDIIESTEAQGLAVYKNENPFIIRVIAIKKKVA